ncbi:MAG: hypothetical protein Q9179_000992 [Wetmoreana sp. 5 TL-2023]
MHAKRVLQILSLVTAVMVVAFIYSITIPREASDSPRAGGFEETIIDHRSSPSTGDPQYGRSSIDEHPAPRQSIGTTLFPGSPRSNSNYSRVMVIPRMQEDDISWIAKELPGLDLSVYVADDPGASVHPPRNKGHEVMVYLSYLIENYERLPDIVLFMHSHRWTHHNNNFLGFDASQMIRALSDAHVMRRGYVNLRCHWSPGCPQWLRPTNAQDTLSRQEETVLERCWRELFPFDPLPSFLAQPCCAQFALSRDRITSIPRSRYAFYRDWVLRTPLSDYVSGRIWEYTWQYLFTKDTAHCPPEHACYCDGFGLCFGGETPYEQYVELLGKKMKLATELATASRHRHANEVSPTVVSNGSTQVPSLDDTDDPAHLEAQVVALEAELDIRKEEAQRRGSNPRLRAEECGRPWKEGDGF